jgi:hypothetical protein
MCFDTPTTQHNHHIPDMVASDARHLHYSPVVTITLHNQITLFSQNKCGEFKPELFLSIVDGLLGNPAYQKPINQYGLLMAIARIYQIQGNNQKAITKKIEAFMVQPNIFAAHTIVTELLEGRKEKEVLDFIKQARQVAPIYNNQYDEWENSVMSNQLIFKR